MNEQLVELIKNASGGNIEITAYYNGFFFFELSDNFFAIGKILDCRDYHILISGGHIYNFGFVSQKVVIGTF